MNSRCSTWQVRGACAHASFCIRARAARCDPPHSPTHQACGGAGGRQGGRCARELEYDVLILAFGSRANDFGTPGIVEQCHFIDSQDQADAFNARLPKAAFVARLRSSQSPGQTARQLPDPSTLIRVEPSSTGETRLQGAHRSPYRDRAARAVGRRALRRGRSRDRGSASWRASRRTGSPGRPPRSLPVENSGDRDQTGADDQVERDENRRVDELAPLDALGDADR